MSVPHEELRGDHEVFDSFAYVLHAAIQDQAQQYVEYLGYRPVDMIQKTLENTSQMAHKSLHFPMCLHIKARFPWLNCNHLRKRVATNTYFANVCAIGGATCAQVFYGVKSHMINVSGMKSESEMPEAYIDFIHEEGAYIVITLKISLAHVQQNSIAANISSKMNLPIWVTHSKIQLNSMHLNS
jgi:hypothetical protein